MTKGDRPVVVVTNLEDPTADLVIAELQGRGVPVVRLDSGDFPDQLSVTARVGCGQTWSGTVDTPSRRADLSAVRSLYYRRPSGFTFPHLSAQDARFAVVQARYGLGGVFASLPSCLYVNHPHRIGDCSFKPAQLAAAVDIGFDVPDTLFTSDPDAARAFVKENASAIYKPLAIPPYLIDNIPYTVGVRTVEPDEIDERVAGTVHLFQALVEKIADVRVTVIGNEVFCVRIDSGLLDWRTNYSRHSYRVVSPPAGLEDALHAFLRRFGLVFGAFDFALGPDNRWWFLECNPSGQWAWLEEPTGLPLSSTIADLLERGHAGGPN